MRRYLKRNYTSSLHLKTAALYEEGLAYKASKESSLHVNGSDTFFNPNIPCFNSALIVEAKSTKDTEDDEEGLSINDLDHSMVDKQKVSSSSVDRNSCASSDQNLVLSTLGVAPGFVPSEADERIILEAPSLMVRPLKLARGIFQVSLNFGICLMT